MDNNKPNLIKDHTIAVLGPENSYSEEVTKNHFPDAELVLCNSIGEVIEFVFSKSNSFALIPIENLLHGPVTEVLDNLTNYYIKHNSSTDLPEILLSLTFPITHFIGTPEHLSTTPLSEIEEIYSHPQALHQSREFIDLNLAKAEKKSVKSTSLSPLYALKSKKKSAAIASKKALLASSFAIRGETVQGDKKNQTRFALLGRPSIQNTFKDMIDTLSNKYPVKTSICIHPGKDRQGLLLDLLTIISEDNKCNLLSIHSRPDESGGFIFYFDIEGDKNQNPVHHCINDLQEYCTARTASISQVLVFGSYPCQPFIDTIIHQICLIGSEGNMGKWLYEFFEKKGIKVLPIDVNSSTHDKQLIKHCDVIFFSTPMKETGTIAKSLYSHIAPHSLIMENCSVKSHSLKEIQEIFKTNFEVLGVHTMFGPGVAEIVGQNVILTRTSSSGTKSQAFEDFLYKHGAIIHHSNIEEHDKIVSILQTLCQFSALAVANVLNTCLENKDAIQHFLTPNALRILITSKNVFEQSESLTYDLQNENPFSKEVRNEFIKEIQKLDALLDQENSFKNELSASKNSLLPTLRKLTKE